MKAAYQSSESRQNISIFYNLHACMTLKWFNKRSNTSQCIASCSYSAKQLVTVITGEGCLVLINTKVLYGPGLQSGSSEIIFQWSKFTYNFLVYQQTNASNTKMLRNIHRFITDMSGEHCYLSPLTRGIVCHSTVRWLFRLCEVFSQPGNPSYGRTRRNDHDSLNYLLWHTDTHIPLSHQRPP